MVNKEVFETKAPSGDKLTLAVVRPNAKQTRKAQMHYAKAFREYLEAGAMLRAKIDSYLREQNLWDDAKQAERMRLDKIVTEGRDKLERGGIKLSEAKKIALDMRAARMDLVRLISEFTAHDNNTVEGLADNSRFDYLVSVCTVYNDTGDPYFLSFDDYQNRATEDAAVEAANHLSGLIYGINMDFESKLPENEFLRKQGFTDEKGRLINKDGKWVDEEGRLIDEEGYYVDKDGNRCTIDGQPVKDGKVVQEFSPFLDDDGQPLSNESPQVEILNEELVTV
jgi:hypothetical protein